LDTVVTVKLTIRRNLAGIYFARIAIVFCWTRERIESMKKLIALLSSSLLLAALCVTATTHATAIQTGAAPAKPTKTIPPPPKSDSDIQKCIQDKLAKAKTLGTESITVIVANGQATLTGTVKKSGEKGGATNICKSCGATKVTNNITFEKAAKPTPTPKP
jgi:hypothetical protein